MRTSTRFPNRSAGDGRPSLGRRGEDVAAGYLAARGYQIVARNVRADRVELDLIVRRGTSIVFVEVKTRRGAGHGEAALAVDERKQRRLRHGARAWLASRPREAVGVQRHRFDVITCLLLDERAVAKPSPNDPQDLARPDRTREDETGRPNETSAPDGARWSIEHWQSAF